MRNLFWKEKTSPLPQGYKREKTRKPKKEKRKMSRKNKNEKYSKAQGRTVKGWKGA